MAGALASLTACSMAPVSEPSSVRFNDPQVTLDERTAQIDRAGTGLGWQMRWVAPGELEARRQERDRSAVLAIRFDAARFSIQRRDSSGFAYRDGEIEIAFNRWIVELQTAILAQSSV